MQHVIGNLYRGQTEAEETYNQCCTLYVLYPDQSVAMEIGTVNVDNSIDEVQESCKRKSIDTQEAFISGVKKRIENQDHVQLTYIEYLKYIDSSLIDACMESRKAFAIKQEQIRKERQKKYEAESQRYVVEQNAEAEKAVVTAIEIIKNGGILENKQVTFYRNKYDSSSYSIVNFLMRKNGVNVPIKTQGWINEKLAYVNIAQDGGINVRFWKSKNGKCSDKFFDYMFELVRIIRSENC